MSDSIDNLKNSLNGTTIENPLLNLGYSSKSVDSAIKLEQLADMSLGSLANDIAGSAGRLNQLVHTAYCIGQALTNPAMLLNILDQIAGNLVATAVDMAGRIFTCIEGQIKGAIGKVTNAISNIINSVLDFLNAIENLLRQIEQILENLLKMGEETWYKFLSQEDCEFLLSMIAQCLLNKLFGSELESFERKVTNKVNQVGWNTNQAITDELASTKNLTNFLNKETFMVNKAAEQLSMF